MHAESSLHMAGLRLRGALYLSMVLVATVACGDGAPGTSPTLPDTLSPETDFDLVEGERLFDQETFGGNGRTCLTCHMEDNGTITLEAVARRFAADPGDELFLHDGLDDGLSGTSRIRSHATIRVELALPPHVTLADNPAQRTIVVNRGVPSTMNAPALDGRAPAALMLDLREPDLQSQATNAIRGHAQSGIVLTARQLNSIAAFQERNQRFFSSTRLREFSEGGAPPLLPPGVTESERRGRTFFEDVTPSPGGKEGVCGMCHSGPLLNQVNAFGERETGVPAGAKIGNALVAQTNALRNPTFTFLVDGPGSRRTVIIADPGIMLTPRSASPQMSAFVPTDLHPAELAGFFKTPSLWGVRRTPPYFHDNSARTLREVVDHYADVFFRRFPVAGTVIELTEQDRQDIVAFLESL